MHAERGLSPLPADNGGCPRTRDEHGAAVARVAPPDRSRRARVRSRRPRGIVGRSDPSPLLRHPGVSRDHGPGPCRGTGRRDLGRLRRTLSERPLPPVRGTLARDCCAAGAGLRSDWRRCGGPDQCRRRDSADLPPRHADADRGSVEFELREPAHRIGAAGRDSLPRHVGLVC